MLLTTIFCLTILLISNTQATIDSFLGLLESENLHHQVLSCPIASCKYTQIEIDSRGHTWPTYCYSCTDGEEEVTFRKIYSPISWTYYISQTEGNPNYQFRVIEKIERCIGNNVEIDKQGKNWKLWCYENGSNVKFEITGDESSWTYVEDYDAGYSRYEYRRILCENMVFLEEESNEDEDLEDENNLFLMISADEDDDLSMDFIDEEIESGDSDEIVRDNSNVTISSDESESLNWDNKEINSNENNEEENYELDVEINHQNELSDIQPEISEGEESKVFDKSLNISSVLNTTIGEEEISLNQNDIENEELESEENIIENFDKNSADIVSSSADVDESSINLDENLANPDEDQANFESVSDLDEVSVSFDEGQIEVDENPVNVEESPNITDENTAKVDEGSEENSTSIDENSINLEESSDESSANTDESSVKIDENSINPDENSTNIDESSINTDESSTIIDESSINLDEGSENIDSSINVDEGSENVDESSISIDETPVADENSVSIDEIPVVVDENSSDIEENANFSDKNIDNSDKATTINQEDLNSEEENLEKEPQENNPEDDDDIICFDNPEIEETIKSSISIPNDEEFVFTPVKQISPFDIMPPNPSKQAENSCFNLEGDRSGRYFIQHYTVNHTLILYEKDQNDNYIWNSSSHSRVPIDKTQEIEEIDISLIDLFCVCPLYDENGKAIELEQDEIINGIFWEVVYEGENRVKYLPSISEEEKSQGMYMIDSNTGFRLRMF